MFQIEWALLQDFGVVRKALCDMSALPESVAGTCRQVMPYCIVPKANFQNVVSGLRQSLKVTRLTRLAR